ncbi:hypothetical protein V495_04646 [Pseudogymnoascus sp. VKM F-4514 (FW-929)]|nr:hypothetical protein V495_04646 [Pseudogymnoascus sp. VKM F-4514 (FW-929)]KFY65243.1 hypothetical protein V497_01443 [Pseudogymnoascus sp. VKM F-4516 (FW-969)]
MATTTKPWFKIHIISITNFQYLSSFNMRSLAIFAAILGFCLQNVNAAVIREFSPVPEFEVLGETYHTERAETFVANENSVDHAALEEIQKGISINSDIITREKAMANNYWLGVALEMIQCVWVYHSAPYDPDTLEERRKRVAGAIALCLSIVGRNLSTLEVADFKRNYISRYTDHKFPPTRDG